MPRPRLLSRRMTTTPLARPVLRDLPARPSRVAVLAVDLPYVTAATWQRLDAAYAGDGAVLIDDGGRRALCGVFSTPALVAAGSGDVHGLSMRRLLDGLELVDVIAIGDEACDVDTWADVRALREAFDA